MIIHIENLTFDCIVGILDEERKVPQKVIIDCKIHYNYKKNDFINYAIVADLIEKKMKKERFELIETALLDIIDTIKLTFINISSIKLKISKPTILDKCDVSVALKKDY